MPCKLDERGLKSFQYLESCNTLLDIGCDRGGIVQAYVYKAKKVCAVDINKEAIAEAKEKYPHINFKTVSSEKLPFSKHCFDAVTITDTFEHVNNEQKMINEIYRVLKPNGVLVFSVPHKGLFGWIDSFNLKFIFPKLYRFWKGKSFNPKIYQLESWHRHYSLNDLNRFFKGKFKIQKIHIGGLLIFPIFWILKDAFSFLRKKPFVSFLDFLSDIDYKINYGKSGYNILIKARKI